MNLAPKSWVWDYSKGVPNRTTPTAGGWRSRIPPRPGHINYAICQWQGRIPRRAREMAITTRTVGENFTLGYLDSPGEMPPMVRPMLMVSMYGEFNRWWSVEGIDLAHARSTLVVDLIPRNWQSVYGKIGDESRATREQFQRVLDSPMWIGLTFGGGISFGHGVYCASGSATFFLDRLVLR